MYLVGLAAWVATKKDAKTRLERSSCTDLLLVWFLKVKTASRFEDMVSARRVRTGLPYVWALAGSTSATLSIAGRHP
jgi:hypothetical protein